MTEAAADVSSDALIREALRIYRRYAVEVVEGLGLCPWAERARAEGRVAETILLRSDVDVAAAEARALATQPIDIGLLIFPTCERARPEFERFVADVRTRHEADFPDGAPFAMAAFHPSAAADLESPQRLVPFLRRSPDPLIQLVRFEVLDRVKGRGPQGTSFVDIESMGIESLTAPAPVPTSDRVAQANLETVLRVGVGEVERRLADIRRDRDESYARLAGEC